MAERKRVNQAKRRAATIAQIVAAAQELALAHHEVGFTEGYRAKYESIPRHDPAEAKRLYDKNMAQWRPIERKILLLKMRIARAIPKVKRPA